MICNSNTPSLEFEIWVTEIYLDYVFWDLEFYLNPITQSPKHFLQLVSPLNKKRLCILS